MSHTEDIIRDLSKLLYKMFVINPYAAAIQQENGVYLTKYFPFNDFVIENMLKARGAIGCYQQSYRTGLVKWICFDFDCKDKQNPDVQKLYKIYVAPFLIKLKSYGIEYLTEFSGRRGIHVWIIFDEVISKRLAYAIVSKLYSEFESKLNSDFISNFGLDLFPATDNAKGNKVGKQVKLPLSCHKDGKQSFFFNEVLDLNCIYDDHFYSKQKEYLTSYKLNQIDQQCNYLSISEIYTDETKYKYKKYKVINDVTCTVEDIERILSETNVYRNLFYRMKLGTILERDWFVILGTIGVIDKNGELLRGIFSKSPAYNPDLADKNIEKWKSAYNPATFKHLYSIYGLEMEENIDETMTGLEYLLNGLCQENALEITQIKNINKKCNELDILNNVKYTVEKERKYIIYNDENVDISIWNDLNNMKGHELSVISNDIQNIKSNNLTFIKEISFIKYDRYESYEKIRTLISLGAYERVLTTHLALQLAYSLNPLMNSFSYNVIFTSKFDIFYNWFTSWRNFIDHIKMFLEVPYLSDWGVMAIDIKSFYDNIDFLAIYNLFQEKLGESERNIFRFLIRFNDDLMRNIKGSRIGVPQGPAYARIISEMFLNTIFEKIMMIISGENYKMYRYVDDIVLFYSASSNGNELFSIIKKMLRRHGLEINVSKSRDYGVINSLTTDNRNQIMKKNIINYELQVSNINCILGDGEKIAKFRDLISDKYDINNAAYIFGKNTDDFFTRAYFKKFKKNIFSEVYGRGSAYASFYRYLFANKMYLVESLEENCFSLIKINSLNFKNCISQLYLAIQNEEVSIDDIDYIFEQYFAKIDLEEISEGERTTINSIIKWRGKNNDN